MLVGAPTPVLYSWLCAGAAGVLVVVGAAAPRPVGGWGRVGSRRTAALDGEATAHRLGAVPRVGDGRRSELRACSSIPPYLPRYA